MRKTRLTALAAGILVSCLSLRSQNLTDLRVTEIVAENENGLVDDHGARNGWIEIFNNSNGTVRFGGCYLSDDRADLTKYHIPTSDRSVALGPRQSVVFHASGDAAHGTFHTNFRIEKGETIFLVSTDGRTILDSLAIPSDLQADKAVKKVPTGLKETDFKVVSNVEPGPGSYNGELDGKTKNQIMKENDPHGWVLTLISVSTVFLALIVLAFVFTRIGKASDRKKATERKGSGKIDPEVAAAISMALSQEFGGEVYAAIALALDDYLGNGGVHDEESLVITIKPSAGSQWNNKTLNFRKSPR